MVDPLLNLFFYPFLYFFITCACELSERTKSPVNNNKVFINFTLKMKKYGGYGRSFVYGEGIFVQIKDFHTEIFTVCKIVFRNPLKNNV